MNAGKTLTIGARIRAWCSRRFLIGIAALCGGVVVLGGLDLRINGLAAPANELPPLRRIVTGHDAKGTAKVLLDGVPTNGKAAPSGNVSTLIWSSDETPADIAIGETVEDYGARIVGTAPPARGTRFAVIDFAPGSTGEQHRTESLDYVIVISGEIEMQMDQSVVTLKAGDVMVQRGTNHGWTNRSNQTARVAFVLMDAKPIGIGHAVSGSQNAR